MKNFISSFIDFFYPPFKKIMPLQTYRYAACGGGNTVIGLLIYFICLHFIFERENFDAGFMVFKPQNASLFVQSFFSFFIGFLLNKYIVFTTSFLKGRVQFFRYFLSFFVNLVINYFLLNLFTQYLHIDKFIAQVFSIGLVIIISYFTQRHFTFRVKKDGEPEFSNLQ
ncbi:MAG: GtrA family protein [Bacteroidetes bacterium]|nr:GtrA family protein [Bacteroidota bacterium]MBS1757310.1 GtrA family protein [Bacteroidota bacterium]